MNQALLGVDPEGTRQWAEANAQEVLSEHEEEILYCAVTERGCGVALSGDIPFVWIISCARCPGVGLFEQGGWAR